MSNRAPDTNPFSDPPPYYDDPPRYDDEERPILGDTIVVTRRKRSVAGTICSAVFITPYLVLLCAPLFVIGFFAATQNQIQSGCLLYATSSDGNFQWGHNAACPFTIYGEAAISVFGIILVLLTIVKTARGKWLSPLIICEFILLVMSAMLSLAVGINLAIGLHTTCMARGKSCSKYEGVNIYDPVHKAEVAAWIVFCAAFLVLVIEIVCVCISCLIRQHSATRTTYRQSGNDFE